MEAEDDRNKAAVEVMLQRVSLPSFPVFLTKFMFLAKNNEVIRAQNLLSQQISCSKLSNNVDISKDFPSEISNSFLEKRSKRLSPRSVIPRIALLQYLQHNGFKER
jgi:hypothetical protein